jgi:hypothetical protein
MLSTLEEVQLALLSRELKCKSCDVTVSDSLQIYPIVNAEVCNRTSSD